MRHMANGKVVEIPTAADGSVNSDQVRRAAGIPADRPLVLQTPDGSNRIVNPGEVVRLKPDQFSEEIPDHKRGGA